MAEDKTTPTTEEQKPKSKLPMKTIIIIAIVSIIEGGVFFGLKVMTKPKAAAATDSIGATIEAPEAGLIEVDITEDDMRVDNWVLGGARMMITIKVVATTQKDKSEKLITKIDENNNQIKDRINTLIGQAQPDHIRDPEHQVIKRELKAAIEDIVGEGLIEGVLIPSYASVTID